MMPLIIPAAITAAVAVLAILVRLDAVYLFLSIAVGEILVLRMSNDAGLIASGFIKSGNSNVIATLILLGLPVLLTFLFLKKTAKRSSFLLQLVPVIASAACLAIFVVDQLSADQQKSMYGTKIGNLVHSLQDPIIAVTALLVLLLAWLTHRHKAPHTKHHK